MKVILMEKVPFLGSVGEIVQVSPGYGRNYLLPRKLAVVASEKSERELQNYRRRLAKKIAEEKERSLSIQKKLEGLTLEVRRKVGSRGKLFGAVTTLDISKELTERGIHVERRSMSLERPIKSLGLFDVRFKNSTGVDVSFQVKVSPDSIDEDGKQVEVSESSGMSEMSEGNEGNEGNEDSEGSENSENVES